MLCGRRHGRTRDAGRGHDLRPPPAECPTLVSGGRRGPWRLPESLACSAWRRSRMAGCSPARADVDGALSSSSRCTSSADIGTRTSDVLPSAACSTWRMPRRSGRPRQAVRTLETLPKVHGDYLQLAELETLHQAKDAAHQGTVLRAPQPDKPPGTPRSRPACGASGAEPEQQLMAAIGIERPISAHRRHEALRQKTRTLYLLEALA